jgi:hypothetical protein
MRNSVFCDIQDNIRELDAELVKHRLNSGAGSACDSEPALNNCEHGRCDYERAQHGKELVLTRAWVNQEPSGNHHHCGC